MLAEKFKKCTNKKGASVMPPEPGKSHLTLPVPLVTSLFLRPLLFSSLLFVLFVPPAHSLLLFCFFPLLIQIFLLLTSVLTNSLTTA